MLRLENCLFVAQKLFIRSPKTVTLRKMIEMFLFFLFISLRVIDLEKILIDDRFD